jgi:hypothetical protein
MMAGLSLMVGCAQTQQLTQDITTQVRSTVAEITSSVDPAVANQIPADKREGFAKAEYDVKVASEKLKLAQLKSEQAAYQEKIVNYEEDMAANFRHEAEVDYDLLKMDAIIKAGLGKNKEDNNKKQASLQSKKLKLQADRKNIQANIESAKSKVADLTAQIAKMDEAVKAMKFEGK